MNKQTRLEFDMLYSQIVSGNVKAWDYFTNLCRRHNINREQLLDELAFDKS